MTTLRQHLEAITESPECSKCGSYQHALEALVILDRAEREFSVNWIAGSESHRTTGRVIIDDPGSVTA